MKLLRKRVLQLAACSAIIGGTFYQNYDKFQLFASSEVAVNNQMQKVALQRNICAFNTTAKWNWNWDSRQPHCMLNPTKYQAASEPKQQEMLAKVTPTATRNIFLIRHGQYELGEGEKYLTALGREQAKLLGKRLNAANISFEPVHVSTMNRARETATLMLQEVHKCSDQKLDCMLEEGAPCMPEPGHREWNPEPVTFYTDGARIEAAFRKHIHRASPKQKEDSNELYICHGNVIRYFVCRALQFPVEGWLRIALANTSITWLTLYPDGRVSLRCMGDAGHLPADKISFN